MDIYVPTLARRSSDTTVALARAGLFFRIVCSNTKDFSYWSSIYPPDYMILCPHQGIAKTRQWLIEKSPQKICMVDDDLVFARRRDDDPTKFRDATSDEILQLFTDISNYLDEFAHVGVATREGGNRDIQHTVANTRLLRILAYRADVLRNQDVRFDRVELMEDFDVTLQLLRLGYPNLKINWIVHNQRSSNAPGGCSTYRTLEKQREAAERLASLHSEFVDTVVKTTKSAWNGQTRTDVRIQWKAAFDSAGKVTLLDSRAEPDNAQERTGPSEALEQ